MNESFNSIKGIADNLGNCLKLVNVSDAANDKVGGVSVTSRQKSLIAALSVSAKTDEIPVTEPLIIRKILEAILTGALVPASTLPVQPSLTNFPTPFQEIDENHYVERAEYDRVWTAYSEIFEKANSPDVVILSKEEYEDLGLSEEQIERIVDIAQNYEYGDALVIIKQFLTNDEENGEDSSSGY